MTGGGRREGPEQVSSDAGTWAALQRVSRRREEYPGWRLEPNQDPEPTRGLTGQAETGGPESGRYPEGPVWLQSRND